MIENENEEEKLSEGSIIILLKFHLFQVFRKKGVESIKYIHIEDIKLLSKIKLNKVISPFSVRAMESVVPPGIIGRVRSLAEVVDEKSTPMNSKLFLLS